jgi:hypothetical protein
MRRRLIRALVRPTNHRGVRFRSKGSPRGVSIGLPLRPTAEVLAGMAKITTIEHRP